MPDAPSGFLAIDKPAGWTSHDVVAKLRRITGVRTIGHAGTLDPFATGLLIVGIGRAATRRLAEFQKQDKTYEATARFDGTSDTDDGTGTITRAAPKGDAEAGLPTARIQAAFAAEIGTHFQDIPAYSAKKVGGKKRYELARAGEALPAGSAEITVRSIEVTRIAWPEVDFRIDCSTGTYVRAIARDVGQRLGTGGYLTALRRTRSGSVGIEKALPLERLTADDWTAHLWT